MQCKSPVTMILTLMLLSLNWGSIGNLNLNGMQTVDASCQHLGQISKIQDGFVERKQPGGRWQKIVPNTKLCYGDLVKTTSNRRKKVTVIIKCTAPDNAEKRVPADQTTGVANACSDYLVERSTTNQYSVHSDRQRARVRSYGYGGGAGR